MEAEGGDPIVNAVLRKSKSHTLHIVCCHQPRSDEDDGSGEHTYHVGNHHPHQQQQGLDALSGDRLALSSLSLPTARALQASLLTIIEGMSGLSFAAERQAKIKAGEANSKSTNSKRSGSRRASKHALADSQAEAVTRTKARATATENEGGDDDAARHEALAQTKEQWEAVMRDSRWLRAVKDYIEGALKVTHLVAMGESVMVQNDEGKDAVTVVVSLAQVRRPALGFREKMLCSGLIAL